jgi:hypothetical protein
MFPLQRTGTYLVVYMGLFGESREWFAILKVNPRALL